MTTSREAILRLFRLSDNRAVKFEPQDAIFPGYQAPVVRVAADGERELVMMIWGFILLQAGRAPHRVTNVRDDKILTSSFWKPSFQERRCLVPVSSYCEPKGEKPATWYWFALQGAQERPPFAFPGVWRSYTGPIKKDGPHVSQEVFSFLTTEPNQLTIDINHERMPVLLSGEEQFETWLTGSPADAFALARPFPAEGMRVVQFGDQRKDLLEISHEG